MCTVLGFRYIWVMYPNMATVTKTILKCLFSLVITLCFKLALKNMRFFNCGPHTSVLALGRHVVLAEECRFALCVCVCVCETGGCPTVVSPVYSRKSWTSGTTIVTGSSPDTDGFAFPPLATLHLCLHLTHCDTCDTHKHTCTHKTDQPHLA